MGLVATFAEAIGLLLFVIPGLFLVTIRSVYPPMIALENNVGLDALSRSHDLVRGIAWRAFGVLLLLEIPVAAVAVVVTAAILSAHPYLTIAVRLAVDLVVVPIYAPAANELYFALCAASTAS